MKKIFYFILITSLIIPININANEKIKDESKEEVSKNTKDGLIISSIGTIIVLTIIIIYKKKKIKF